MLKASKKSTIPRFAVNIRQYFLNHATAPLSTMAIPTSLTPSISIPQLCSVIDSAFPDLDLSTNDRDTPSPSLSSEGDPISKAYFESFPLSEAQRTILENSYAASSGFSSELDIDNPSTESPTSSMSVVDGDRVSEDGHLHAAAVS